MTTGCSASMASIRLRYKWLLASLLILLCTLENYAQIIEIEITGIRSKEGQIVILVYKDNQSFRKEQPFQMKTFLKREINEGMMTVEMALEEGIYGLGLIDDENGNGEMDYKMIRLTKEGFAFSNFYLSGLKRPGFDDFKFVVKKDQKKKVTMKIRYM